jgi:ribosome-binding ATPase YchF (GTP1/OBG family)
MKTPSNLKTALEKVKGMIDGRQKIEAEISKAINMQPAAEGRLQDAMEALGTAEADAALSDRASDTTDAHKVLRAARESTDAVAARIGALRRKLAQSDDEVIAAAAELEQAWSEYAEKYSAGIRAAFLIAAEEFAKIVNSSLGLASSLGVSLIGLDQIQLLHPATGLVLEFSPHLQRFNSSPNGTFITAAESLSSIAEPVRQMRLLATRLSDAQRQREESERIRPEPGRGVPAPTGDYRGLSDAEWRTAQLSAPRPANHIRV